MSDLVQTRPWRRATFWLLVLTVFFFLSYGLATWITAQRTDVGSAVFAWERHIPFLPWTIIPYWSIDVLYGLSLFICTTPRELDTHARRLLTAQITAVSCFILLPLTFAFPRPEPDGIAGLLFEALGKFDKPFNQAPSLHIALLVILWDRFARHIPSWSGPLVHGWFALIGISVLTTYQHHFLDIPTGVLLGFVCIWLWPEDMLGPLSQISITANPKRRRLAAYYAAGAVILGLLAIGWGGTALWLLWPAVSLFLVAANYAMLGPMGFQKTEDGAMSLAARWLFAPYLVGAWLNSRAWTYSAPNPVEVVDEVFLGRFPSRHDAAAFPSVVDLCAELPRPERWRAGGGSVWRSIPMLDLIPPEPALVQQAAEAIEQARARGPVLVCCALGYGRSAAAAAGWLLVTGRARDLAAANDQIRAVRPKVVLRDPAGE